MNMNAKLSSLDQFRAYVEEAAQSNGPIVKWLDLDPELARYILGLNPERENRAINENTVRSYAKDMLSGRWQSLNGQQIVISIDGKLNDGQHRCSAVVDAKVTIKDMQFLFGVARDSRMTIDQGMARTQAAYLRMSGVDNSSRVAAIASIMSAYEKGALIIRTDRNTQRKDKLTKTELFEYTVKRLELINRALHLALGSLGAVDNAVAPVAQMAAAICILCQHSGASHTEVENFVLQIMNGAGLDMNNPAYRAREKLIMIRMQGSRGFRRKTSVPVLYVLEVIFRAWLAHRRGKTIEKGITIKGELPKIS